MVEFLVLLPLLFLVLGVVHGQTPAPVEPTGDSQCSSLMCISATVSASTVEYALSSTGKENLGWMAMGFGAVMAHSPMVIMWPNNNGSVTLSQRIASGEVAPSIDVNPPRIASLNQSLSIATSDTPKLVYTIPTNSDTLQNVIWAFGTELPSSSSADALIWQHIESGTFTLNLIKSLSGPATSRSIGATLGLDDGSRRTLIIAHGVLCLIGFLLFLPAGALIARYGRVYTSSWIHGHWIFQLGLGGTSIASGVILGICVVADTGSDHLNDSHKKWGIALFALYFVQCGLGAFIHWVKPNQRFHRPPQNYVHAVIGLIMIGLAFYQARTGYRVEWSKVIGETLPKSVTIVWYAWIGLLLVLYAVGLVFLPRQYALERLKSSLPISDELFGMRHHGAASAAQSARGTGARSMNTRSKAARSTDARSTDGQSVPRDNAMISFFDDHD